MTQRREDGADVELARLADGDQFGELALLRDAPRNATVTCITDCLLLSLTRSQFLDLIATTPRIREEIERVAKERTAKARGTSLAATLQ